MNKTNTKKLQEHEQQQKSNEHNKKQKEKRQQQQTGTFNKWNIEPQTTLKKNKQT